MDLEHGRELWKTDGTRAVTRLVKGIEPGPGSSASRNLTAICGTLFFRAVTSGQGYEPWLSNSTRKGTRPLQEIAPHAPSQRAQVRGIMRGQWERVVDPVSLGANSSRPSQVEGQDAASQKGRIDALLRVACWCREVEGR
ncbi:hypothetical protein MVI01_68160 [Myxococcus virescens]|uniref:Uncharacterized protein n=1 Tax=Myxococcus virescens TaxID=83456 RepID=A0A511HN66_9BACT|nr:hypothetical protein MVI01_68160 [Myxococcus virescens]